MLGYYTTIIKQVKNIDNRIYSADIKTIIFKNIQTSSSTCTI